MLSRVFVVVVVVFYIKAAPERLPLQSFMHIFRFNFYDVELCFKN